jgi:hypothetical protein
VPTTQEVELLPAFAAELERALRADGKDELADQVAGLVIESLCGCGDDFCSSFYTGVRPVGAWGPALRNVKLSRPAWSSSTSSMTAFGTSKCSTAVT